jgi:hypothetical protein
MSRFMVKRIHEENTSAWICPIKIMNSSMSRPGQRSERIDGTRTSWRGSAVGELWNSPKAAPVFVRKLTAQNLGITEIWGQVVKRASLTV